jgi:hypothetical protein
LVFLLLSGAERLCADGCFIPDVAYAKLPAIPAQRALLTYKDGIETLVIESSLDAEGQSFGWVIPLPAEPTDFRRVSPGLLKTLPLNIGPRITHDLGLTRRRGPMLIAGAITAAALLAVAFKFTRQGWVLLLLVLAVGGAMLLPALGTAGGDYGLAIGAEGVAVKKAAVIGSYEVTVLAAERADALDTWLKANGFASIPKPGQPIVADYITRGWCFVAAKLRREGAGLSTPHPLLMSFPVKAPVYPMRLTALAGSDVHLDLFVCADGTAHNPQLRLDYCDRHCFRLTSEGGEQYAGESFRASIAHPAAKGLLWPGCVLTRLSADLRPAQMSEDLQVKLVPYQPYQRHLYSHKGALQTGLTPGIWLWCGGLVAGVFLVNKRIQGEGGRRFALVKLMLPLLVVSAVPVGVIYLVLPKVEVFTAGNPWALHNLATVLVHQAQADINEYPPGLPWTPGAVAEFLKEGFAKEGFTHPVTREPVQVEDSPGNLTVTDEAGQMLLQVHRKNGSIDSCPLGRPGGKER